MMIPELHIHVTATRRAVDRIEQLSNYFTAHPVPARENMAESQTYQMDGAHSILQNSNGFFSRPKAPTSWKSPASMTVTLPSFKHFAEVADQSVLQYMRSPSIGSEYLPVPLVKLESAYNSLSESVASFSPSVSVSPVVSSATASNCKAVGRRSPPPSRSRVEKKTKPTKRKGMSARAERLDYEINRRVDEIHRPYRDGNMSGGSSSRVSHSQSFPRFNRAQIPRGPKRAKSATGSSNPNIRHNVAQTFLRAEKGGSRMTLQRLLVSGVNWRGLKLQTKVNARSSGMLYEEKELLSAGTQLNALGIIFMQALFTPDGMQQLGGVLENFEPEEVHPVQVVRDPQDDDKTYDFKCQAARIEVIAEASQPLGLKNLQSTDELIQMLKEKILPLTNTTGQAVLHQICHGLKEDQARF